MKSDVYGELVDALYLRKGGMIALKCSELIAVLEELFSQEEAELALKLPLEPVTVSALVSGEGRTSLERKLESMADKGLVYVTEKAGEKYYQLLPLLPGILEFQFLKGEVDEHAKKVAALIKEYMRALKRYMTEQVVRPASAARVIIIQEDFPQRTTIYPYSDVLQFIENSENIAVGICLCRHEEELLGNAACVKPKETCMLFGPEAKFAAERRFARIIDKEEARRILDATEEAGLIHSAINKPGIYLNFLCNCCICHCKIMRGAKRSGMPTRVVIANYVITIDDDACNTCGLCVERCQMEALKFEGERLMRDDVKCIGCGLCMYVCPADALRLEPRVIYTG